MNGPTHVQQRLRLLNLEALKDNWQEFISGKNQKPLTWFYFNVRKTRNFQKFLKQEKLAENGEKHGSGCGTGSP